MVDPIAESSSPISAENRHRAAPLSFEARILPQQLLRAAKKVCEKPQ
jgi:hypothetical protein